MLKRIKRSKIPASSAEYIRSNTKDPESFKTKIHKNDEILRFQERYARNKDDALLDYFKTGKFLIDKFKEIIGREFGGFENIDSLLDFACGHGRFTRFLVQEISPERIWVSDIFPDAVEFQKEQFGVHGFISSRHPELLNTDRKFDCIIAISLLSHMPETLFASWIKKLYGILNENGVLLFSVHDESMLPKNLKMPAKGIFFIPENPLNSLAPTEYGTSYVSETFVAKKIRQELGRRTRYKRLPGFIEQDLYVIRKTAPLKDDQHRTSDTLLSIVIPCFNDGQYLTEALACLDRIHGTNYEVIVVDDGSTDPGTLGILRSLDRNKFILIGQSHKGPAAARNRGIKAAKGKYILPLDADNMIKPEYIYKSLGIMEEDQDIDIVYADRQEFGMVERTVRVPDFDINKMISGGYIDTCAVFRKKVWEVCGGYDENMIGWEDWEFWLSAYEEGFSFYHIDEPLFLYRIKENSVRTQFFSAENWTKTLSYIYSKHTELINHTAAIMAGKIAQFEKNERMTEEISKRLAEAEAKNKQYQGGTYFVFDKIMKLLTVLARYPYNMIMNRGLFGRFIDITLRSGLYAALLDAYGFLLLKDLHAEQAKQPVKRPSGITLYDSFIKDRTLSAEQIDEIKKEIEGFPYLPRISIIIPVFDIEPEILKRTVESAINQVYENLEICIANGSSNPEVKNLLDLYKEKDQRVKLLHMGKNLGISGNSNTALRLASGQFVAFLDHDDELMPDALFEAVKTLQYHPETDLIYTDEDKTDVKSSVYYEPFFKPDWSPDLLLSMNYICHLLIMRKELVDRLNGFRPEFDGAQDYDLVLRATEISGNIRHIPKVLYHWRAVPSSVAGSLDAKPYCFDMGKKALEEAMKRRKIKAEVTRDGAYSYRTRYLIESTGKVSIIIPTKDQKKLMEKCVSSILNRTIYNDYEIIIVDNGSSDISTANYLKSLLSEHDNIKVIEYLSDFNYSKINNLAAASASGKYLLFLNNDVEVINEDWLSALVEHAQRPEVGAVGCKLLYPDNTIQHAGVIFNERSAGHAFYKTLEKDSVFNLANVVRNYSAVTGACLMIRKDLFESIGGFDGSFWVTYGDVDICFTLRSLGYRIIYTPYCRLYHMESVSRGSGDWIDDSRNYYQKWKIMTRNGDPYYNPNLDTSFANTFQWRGY